MNKNKLERIVRLMDEQGVDYETAKLVVESVDDTMTVDDRTTLDKMETPEDAKVNTAYDTQIKYRKAVNLIDDFMNADINEKQKFNKAEVIDAQQYIREYDKIKEQRKYSDMTTAEFRNMRLDEHRKFMDEFPELYEQKLNKAKTETE